MAFMLALARDFKWTEEEPEKESGMKVKIQLMGKIENHREI